MKKLTAEKCCQLLDSLNSNGMSILEGYYVEALEIALPILEQQERGDGWIEWKGGECPVDGERYYLHRLAWFYMHRQWPKGVIDHINRDKTDNRISNLRDVSTQGNVNNSPVKSTNKTGVKGVHICKRSQKYIAQITVDYKCIHLGTFDTIEGAIEARRMAEKRVGELVYGPTDDSINKHLEVDKQRVAPHRNKTSRFKGVAKHHSGKWSAKIVVNKQKKWLGLFDSEEEAGMAYQRYREDFKGGVHG